MPTTRLLVVTMLVASILALGATPGIAAPDGQMIWAVHAFFSAPYEDVKLKAR